MVAFFYLIFYIFFSIIIARNDKVLKMIKQYKHQQTKTNDHPFKIGDKVSVIRTRHGWHNGSLHVIITSCKQNPQGTWSYTAKELDNDFTHEIQHTRDARRLK